MRIAVLLFGALLFVLLASQASAQCLCDEKGHDYCACQGAVRPVPKLLERIASAKFPPIGDTCWCGKQLVEPAVPPKPPCKTAQNRSPPSPPPMPCIDSLMKKSVPMGVPADPISIGLALRAGKAFAVPEAKLSYGPVNVPLNGLKKVYFSHLPEEKLYALNSEVIELKKRIPKKEEIIEEEEEEEMEAPAPPPYLTYHELGYGPAMYNNPSFARCSHFAPPAAATKPKPVGSCGFKLGKISLNSKPIEEDSYIYGGACD